MKRYIDVDKFKLPCTAGDCFECIFFSLNRCIMKEHINNSVTTEDILEVVRCRKCEYWKCNPNTAEYGVCKKASYDDFEVIMSSDDFCSYGKRREE